MRTVTTAERRARLARRHRLAPGTRTDDVLRISDDLLALHSSDPATVFLSAWARMVDPSREAVETALYEDRTLLRHHVMRRTLWVAGRAMMARMHAATGRRVAATEHRRTLKMLTHAGIADPEAWWDDAAQQVLATLHDHGPLTTRQVGTLLPELRRTLESTPGNPKTATISAHSRVLLQLGFHGRVIRGRPSGAWNNSPYSWAVTDRWLGTPLPDPTEREASAELAEAWLHAFGPATATDLQWWMGWTRTHTRRALADAAAVPVELEGDAELGWLAADDEAEEPPTEPWVAVLPSLDATTMGWKQRDWYLSASAADAFDRNGNAGPTLWMDGRVVGAWTQRRDGELRHLWFEPVPAGRRRQLTDRLAELRDWLDQTVVTERFPGRARTALLA